MSSRWFLIFLLLGSFATVAYLWATDVPLGVPGEWTWKRIPFDAAAVREAGLFGIVVALGVAIHILFARQGASRIETAGAVGRAGWLAGLTASAFAVLWILGAAPPGEYPTAKTAWVLYDRGASGYFYEASKIDNLPDFLASYEAMAEGDYVPYGETRKQRDVYHIGTHPPGLIVFHRGLIVLCRKSPAITEAVLATQPTAYSEAFETLSKPQAHGPRSVGFAKSVRAALWLAVILTHLLAAVTVIPLFLLVRLYHGGRAGWMTAALWPLVPALAVFLPKSDALLPFLATLFLWLWISALRNKSLLRAALSGLVMWVGLFTSLALLPVALLAVLLTLWEMFCGTKADSGKRKAETERIRLSAFRFPLSVVRPLLLAAVSIVVFAVAILALRWRFDCCLPCIWWENFQNHAGFYETESNPRSYGWWLPANAVELTIAVGWPAMLLAGGEVVRVFVPPDATGGLRRSREAGPVWCAAAVIGLLWLSGKNMGEAGRLWLFLMPWILWMGAGLFRERSDRMWIAILIVQAVVCWLTAIRVQVFFLF